MPDHEPPPKNFNLEFSVSVRDHLPGESQLIRLFVIHPHSKEAVAEYLAQVDSGDIQFRFISCPEKALVQSNDFKLARDLSGPCLFVASTNTIELSGTVMAAIRITTGLEIDTTERPAGKRGPLPNATIYQKLRAFSVESTEVLADLRLHFGPEMVAETHVVFFLERRMQAHGEQFNILNFAPLKQTRPRVDLGENTDLTLARRKSIKTNPQAAALYYAAMETQNPTHKLPLLVACLKLLIGDGGEARTDFKNRLPPPVQTAFDSALDARNDIMYPRKSKVTDPDKHCDFLEACIALALRDHK